MSEVLTMRHFEDESKEKGIIFTVVAKEIIVDKRTLLRSIHQRLSFQRNFAVLVPAPSKDKGIIFAVVAKEILDKRTLLRSIHQRL